MPNRQLIFKFAGKNVSLSYLSTLFHCDVVSWKPLRKAETSGPRANNFLIGKIWFLAIESGKLVHYAVSEEPASGADSKAGFRILWRISVNRRTYYDPGLGKVFEFNQNIEVGSSLVSTRTKRNGPNMPVGLSHGITDRMIPLGALKAVVTYKNNQDFGKTLELIDINGIVRWAEGGRILASSSGESVNCADMAESIANGLNNLCDMLDGFAKILFGGAILSVGVGAAGVVTEGPAAAVAVCLTGGALITEGLAEVVKAVLVPDIKIAAQYMCEALKEDPSASLINISLPPDKSDLFETQITCIRWDVDIVVPTPSSYINDEGIEVIVSQDSQIVRYCAELGYDYLPKNSGLRPSHNS